MNSQLEVGDIVLCTVEKIAGTMVFVKIDNYGQGSIILSEIAPGRIRNIRNYVVPKKKIICKILRISPNGHIDLSLRRVTPKEQKEIKEKFKQEKSYKSILKTVLKDKIEEVIEKITKEDNLYDFIEETKQDSTLLEKIIGKEDTKKILDILNAQKSKIAIVKKELSLNTSKSDGLNRIKDLFKKISPAKAKYLSAGKYSIELESDNLKAADQELKKILVELEKTAKKQGLEFSIKEK
jgi:translation initiation factor 2 alpha subunit (eIF-2alpha)